MSADPTPLPSEPEAAAPHAARPRWLPWAAAGALALAALAWLVVRGGAARPAPAPAASATLVIDALPWGEVEGIVDAAGRRVEVGSDAYTPLVASLPPGDYVVSVKRPDAARKETLHVTLRAGQVEQRVVVFERIDADEYLEKAGF